MSVERQAEWEARLVRAGRDLISVHESTLVPA